MARDVTACSFRGVDAGTSTRQAFVLRCVRSGDGYQTELTADAP